MIRMVDCRFENTADSVHRAGWVLADPDTLIPNGYVRTQNGVIQEVGQGRIPTGTPVTDYGHGVLMPALINCHTHLELSALEGKIPFSEGFREWVKHLIRIREETSRETLMQGIEQGIGEIRKTGCLAVGEISTLGLSKNFLKSSGLEGIWFKEYLGPMPSEFYPETEISEPAIHDAGVSFSLAGHGPHTTAPELLKALKTITRRQGLPFSLHLAESVDENEFIRTGTGPWAELLSWRNIDFSRWPLQSGGPVHYADRLGLLDEKTLAVHGIHADPHELEILKQRGVHLCLCPRSNRNLHNRLPDLYAMQKAGIRLCLGTDSLAGIESLSLWDEMAFTARSFPQVSPQEILTMATINGAEALGLSHRLGTLRPGKGACFVYISIESSSSSDFLEQVIHETSSL